MFYSTFIPSVHVLRIPRSPEVIKAIRWTGEIYVGTQLHDFLAPSLTSLKEHLVQVRPIPRGLILPTSDE